MPNHPSFDPSTLIEIIENANDVILVTKAEPLDAPGPEIVYVNEAFTELTGYSAEEALGNTPRMLQGPETDQVARQNIRKSLHDKAAVRTEILNYAKDGTPYWLDLSIVPLHDATGSVKYFAAIERDLSKQKELEKELYELSTTDGLTGLYNRRLFFEKAEYELKRIQRSRLSFGLLMIDIDNFKRLNDTYGHLAGDAVLAKIANVLKSTIRDIDIIARYGGEEFITILPLTDQEQTLNIAEKLVNTIGETKFNYQDTQLSVTISIGCTVCNPDEHEITDCIARADKALYAIKTSNRNCAKFEGC